MIRIFLLLPALLGASLSFSALGQSITDGDSLEVNRNRLAPARDRRPRALPDVPRRLAGGSRSYGLPTHPHCGPEACL